MNFVFQPENEPSDLEVQMEAERLVVAQFTAGEAEREAGRPDILTVHQEENAAPSTGPSPRDGKTKTKGKKKPSKPR